MSEKKLKEKEEFQKKFEFTSCDSCANKINKAYQSEYINCKHYYGSRLERKEQRI